MGRRRGGAHVNRSRVRIFREADHLSLKFYKLLCHKAKSERLEDWFYSKEHGINPDRSLPRKIFSELICALDYHEVNAKTGSTSVGKQLMTEQLLVLTRLVASDGAQITYEDVLGFTQDNSSDLEAMYEKEKGKLLKKRNEKKKIKKKTKAEISNEVHSIKAAESERTQEENRKIAAAKDTLNDALHNAHLLGKLMRFLFEQCLPDVSSEW
jgi:hypothetical protein